MSDYTCSKCGKLVCFNVPRLGPDGGFVHYDTGELLCEGESTKLVVDHTQTILSLQSQLAASEEAYNDLQVQYPKEISKLRYVVGEMRKALTHLRSEILPKSRDLESSYERRSYYAQLAGVAVDAINLTPDSLPPLYTEEQIDEFKQLLLHLVKFCELRVVHSDGFPVVQKISELTSTQQRPSQCGGWVGFHGKFYTEEEVRPLVNELSYDTCKQSYSTARCDS